MHTCKTDEGKWKKCCSYLLTNCDKYWSSLFACYQSKGEQEEKESKYV